MVRTIRTYLSLRANDLLLVSSKRPEDQIGLLLRTTMTAAASSTGKARIRSRSAEKPAF